MARAKGFLMVSASPLTRSVLPRRRRLSSACGRPARRRSPKPRSNLGHADPRRTAPSALQPEAAVRPGRRRSNATPSSCPGAAPAGSPGATARPFTPISSSASRCSRSASPPGSRCDPHALIDVEYINGPFRYLNNHWRFIEAEDGGCVIDFYVDFEFRSRMLQRLIGLLFNEAVSRMVGAFETRARQLYGDHTTPAEAAAPCRPAASRA